MLQNSARMKPSEYWVVPTPTPLNLSGEWTKSSDFLNRFTAETLPSHELAALGSKTAEPIISLSGTTTTGILVFTPVSKSPPTKTPVYALPSLVASTLYEIIGTVLPA